ncbi:MAG: DsbE family thiol:disulfide interchange protein [Gammaproteobacteria bacterium]|nr:MAG: DsbE family thiol:disulfide interchange protein [Gammaproteobacteria bacterium]
MWMRLLPLALFAALAAFLWRGLSLDPAELPSPLIDKPAPAFTLATLGSAETPELASSDMLGKVWVLNVWASWCPSCVAEHAVLLDLAAKRDEVVLVGFNYKDTREAATAWLARHGNPFDVIVEDPDGAVGIDWGVYGAPETFLIDAQGKVRYKYVGEITASELENEVLPKLDKLLAEGSGT